MSNPLTLVVNKFWEAVEFDPSISSLVKPGNRIKFNTSTRVPFKPSIQDADAPQMTIWPEGTTPSITASSTSSFYIQRLRVEIKSIDLRLDVTGNVYEIEWALYKILARAKDTWGLCFINMVRPVETQIVSNINGTKGWDLSMRVEVQLNIGRADIYKGVV